MCEPLKGNQDRLYDSSYKAYLVFKYKDVKSAVEFYQRYRITNEDNERVLFQAGLDRLMNEQPKLHKLLKKTNITQKWEYNNWLFDYCFGDVIE